MTFTQPSLTTCLAHLILAGVTGWSLKHLPSGSAPTLNSTTATTITTLPTDSTVPFVLMLLIFLLSHSLLGLFRYSHPDPQKGLRKVYELSALLATVCPLPLLNIQLYLKYQPNESELLLYGYLLISVLVPVLAGLMYSELSQRHKSEYVTTAAVLVNLAALVWVSFVNENYWGIGLAVSCGMKHFTLARLADRYSVPFVDLYTYGLGFFEIFAVNVVVDADLYRTELVIQ
ncbi:uncharacterized protein LOC128745407 [Sabethes cyaneus]|uniref:uncharacterized protein LOC128745407 n=1 Tax=Sabethes cyaneus TaxID=53552 RepID=UPI00237DD8F9|nr:uncharacterized protein LOC128745407 [Sabethes cyaneus]